MKTLNSRLTLLTSISLVLGFQAHAQDLITPSQLESAIDECIATSEMDNFDTVEDVLTRVSQNCDLSGTFRRTAPTLAGLGHIISYDVKTKAYTYVMVPDVKSTIRYGGGASPYGKRYTPLQYGELKKPIRKELRRLGNESFWILPLIAKNDTSSSYKSSNGYGAKIAVAKHRGERVSLNIPIKFRGPTTVASFPMEASVAREVSEHLGLEVEFSLKRPCDICFSGGTTEMGTIAPTFKSPYDIKMQHKWAYAEVTAFKLVDMRTGEIIGTHPFSE